MAAPSRQAILNAYKTILRYSNPKIDGRRPRANTTAGPFAEHVKNAFREGMTADAATAKDLFNQATDMANMLKSSFTHAQAVFDAGWCLQKVCALLIIATFNTPIFLGLSFFHFHFFLLICPPTFNPPYFSIL